MDDTTRVAEALRRVLGGRLRSVALHGSVATGDAIAGFSDLDLVVFAEGPLGLADAIALQQALADEPIDAAHVQLSDWVDVTAGLAGPKLVPGHYRVIAGDAIDEAYLHTEASLRESGRAWLTKLPELLRQDAADWAVAIGPARTRMVRLFATRLKPTLRAALVERGEPPLEAWALSWEGIVERWARDDPQGAEALRSVIAMLPPEPGAEGEVGELLLRLLWAGMEG